MAENNKPRKDEVSGAYTMGHEWDGIEELNIPAPRWWLITWLVSIIFGLGYMVFYPAIPISGGNTKGTLGWTQYTQLEESQQEILDIRSVYSDRIKEAKNWSEITEDQALYEFAMAGGKSAFAMNCAVCHGSGAAGTKGYPNLNDDDWLWGGKLDEIYTTLKYGIRSEHEKERRSEMPAFGRDEILTPQEVAKVTDYVVSLSASGEGYSKEGEKIFADNCVVCHGVGGVGDRSQGAPRLNDAIWLYGGEKSDIIETITNSRMGVMPTWVNKLDDETIKQLTVYVHSLGGGE